MSCAPTTNIKKNFQSNQPNVWKKENQTPNLSLLTKDKTSAQLPRINKEQASSNPLIEKKISDEKSPSLMGLIKRTQDLKEALLRMQDVNPMMSERNGHIFDFLINRASKTSNDDEMENCLQKMKELGLSLNEKNYSDLLILYIRKGRYQDVDSILIEVKSKKINLDWLSLKMLFALKLNNNVGEEVKSVTIEFVFEQLLKNNRCFFSECSALLDHYIKEKKLIEAENLFNRFEQINIMPNVFMYNLLIQAYLEARDFQKINGLLAQMAEKGIKADSVNYGYRISAAIKENNFALVKNVFKEMQDKKINLDVEIINKLLKWSFDNDDADAAFSYYMMMKEKNIKPNEFTLIQIQKFLHRVKDSIQAKQLLDDVEKYEITLGVHFYNMQIRHRALEGNVEAVYSIYSQMQEKGIKPDKYTHYFMLDALIDKDIEEARRYFHENKLSVYYAGKVLDCHNLSKGPAFIQILFHIEQFPGTSFQVTTGKGLHSHSRTAPYAMRTAILEYAKKHIRTHQVSIDANQGVLNFKYFINSPVLMKRPSKVASPLESKEDFWGALNETSVEKVVPRQNENKSYGQYLLEIDNQIDLEQNPLAAIKLMVEMQSLGYSIKKRIYNSLTQLCIRKNCLENAQEVFNYAYLADLDVNIETCHLLIAAYIKKNKIDQALLLFNKMRKKEIPLDKVTYQLLIKSCIHQPHTLIKLYCAMIEAGIQPDIHLGNRILSYYIQESQMAEAADFYKNMVDNQIYANEKTYELFIMALLYPKDLVFPSPKDFVCAGQWFQSMKISGYIPNQAIYQRFIQIYKSTGSLESVCLMFLEMQKLKIYINIDTYNLILSTFVTCQRYQEAVNLYDELQRRNIMNAATQSIMSPIWQNGFVFYM